MSDNPGLDAIIRQNISDFLSDPTNIPQAVSAAVTQFSTLNPVPVQATISPAIIASGVGSASQAKSRYVGATASGPPTSGTYVVGDFIVDQTGALWICTANGTPGTWNRPGSVTYTTITTVGSSTYTTPSGVYAILVECLGGGGGGTGIGASGAAQCSVGSGGGGGAYAIQPITHPAATYTVNVGNGGSGGAAGANSGSSGGDTSFDSVCIAKGGVGGNSGNTIGGGTTIAVSPGSAGGAASGSTGTLKFDGGGALPSMRLSANIGLSYGGGAARGGLFQFNMVNVTSAGNSGQAGSQYGGGGTGGIDTNNTNRAGAAGAQGVILVTEFH